MASHMMLLHVIHVFVSRDHSWMLLCSWTLECGGPHYVLLCMWILHPNQASCLQGCHGVNHAILAVKNWGIGSGWQQSKQNSVLLAVVG